MAVLVRWFPDRRFVFLGDGGFGSHELARWFRRRRRNGRPVALAPAPVTLVSRFCPKANLYTEPPPPPPGKKSPGGRPRKKGEKLPSPRDVVEGCGRRMGRSPHRPPHAPGPPWGGTAGESGRWNW